MIPPTLHPPAVMTLSCFSEMSSRFPICSHIGPGASRRQELHASLPRAALPLPPVPRDRRAPLQLSHPAQPLAGESSTCTMENVSGRGQHN